MALRPLHICTWVGLFAFSLTGCVSQLTTDLDIQSNDEIANLAQVSDAAQPSQTDATIVASTSRAIDGASDGVIEPPGTLISAIPADRIPIPAAPPLRALTSTAQAATPDKAHVQQAIPNTNIADSQTALLAPNQRGENRSDVQIAAESANGENGVIDAPVAVDVSQQTAFVAPPPPQNLSFFQRLLQKQHQRRTEAEKIRFAKAQSNAKRANDTLAAPGDALPGVKQGNDLFGISSEDGDAEEQANIQVASVGSLGRMISKSGLLLQTERVEVGCFRPKLIQVLKIVERRYGKRVMVTSGFRSPVRNRRAGGVKNSTHVYCKAADIQIEGVSKWDLAKYLRTIPGRGGVGTYCRTNSVHIDVGSQRDWHHPCRRTRSKSKKKA